MNNKQAASLRLIEQQTKSSKYHQQPQVPSVETNTPYKFRRKLKTHVELIPKNLMQEELIEYLNDNRKRIVFSIGPAGVGKSYLMTLKAIDMLLKGEVDRIVITRPVVTADEDIGFLPGNLVEKMAPWTRPILDIFEEYFTPKQINDMIEYGTIEICPIAFIRGRTLKNCAIIVDEFQNVTVRQSKAILTRIGEGARMFVTGDVTQTDLNNEKSGLLDMMERLVSYSSEAIVMTKFSQCHVERDPVVAEVLKIYDFEN